jgi:pyruvate/2-oxoglutarate dehydrogenase complex dihydrolipoamide acyltransferase (E2) component
MPRLADTLVEGTLGRWLKQVGERVGQGEALASIETDKVTTDLTSPAAGTILELMVGEGQTVAIETPIARIGDGSVAPERSEAAQPPPPKPAQRKPTPVAARLLAEHGVAADQIPIQSARITKEDVLNFVQARRSDVAPLSQMRRAIAEHMTRARQTIPHGQTVMDGDLTRLVAWREANKTQFQQQEGASLTFTVLFVYALARAMSEPADVGVAVAIDNGLIVPVLGAANRLSLGATARGVAELANRARANQLKPHEIEGAHMTLTNVGSFGNLTAAPIIPLGQLGILGPGLVERRPMPSSDGGIRPGWRCRLAFVFDRRAFDDVEADRFLRGVIEELQLNDWQRWSSGSSPRRFPPAEPAPRA